VVVLKQNEFMQKAIELAYENVLNERGGPFGAVVVKDGNIIGTGTNEVTAKNDPTAHAEIEAIRAACKHLGKAELSDCEIYASGEPCPMCLAAIYWAKPKAVYFAYSKEEAADYGFHSGELYRQMALPNDQRTISMIQLEKNTQANNPFELWKRVRWKKE
jgi:guanine deaminase